MPVSGISDEELLLAIGRLSQIDDKGNVILSKKEAEELREWLTLFRKGKVIRAFLAYLISGIVVIAAYKADLLAWLEKPT